MEQSSPSPFLLLHLLIISVSAIFLALAVSTRKAFTALTIAILLFAIPKKYIPHRIITNVLGATSIPAVSAFYKERASSDALRQSPPHSINFGKAGYARLFCGQHRLIGWRHKRTQLLSSLLLRLQIGLRTFNSMHFTFCGQYYNNAMVLIC